MRSTSGCPDAQAEENAEATRFLEALLYRRYAAKLRYELGFWSAFGTERGSSSRDYEPLLTEATGPPLRRTPLPLRHGRGLLLRRLPARVDPLGAAERVPAPARSATTGGGAARRGRSCAGCSPRARAPRPRTSPAGSASTRSTPRRSSPSSPPPPSWTRRELHPSRAAGASAYWAGVAGRRGRARPAPLPRAERSRRCRSTSRGR